MINLDVKVDINLREVHYPIYFEKRNICVACGAEKMLDFYNIFGKKVNSEVHPFEYIKCSNCGARYSIKWDHDTDDKMVPSAIDPSVKDDFKALFKNTFKKKYLDQNFKM